MESNVSPAPSSRYLNKSFIFLLILTGILLVFSGYVFGQYSAKIKKDVQTTNILQPTVTASVSPIQTKTRLDIPKTSSKGEKIISAKLNEDCTITLVSNIKEYNLETGLAGGMDFKCTASSIGKISPSGKYLAYEDVSGGIDSVMALYTVDYGRGVTLGVWGTSSIMDYIFLPDDRFVAINGYPDIFNEQWISIFDLPSIFKDFSGNFNNEYLYFEPKNPTLESTIQLPNVGKTHKKLSFNENLIQTRSIDGELLVQFEIEELFLNSNNFSISPKTALSLVYYYDEKNVNPVDSPVTKRIINSENSTNDYWEVDVVNSKTSKILRSYQVNQKTGQVNLK